MKRQLPVFTGLLCLLLLGASTSIGGAQVSFSAGIRINATADFNRPLTPFGSWVTVSSYGRGWRPAHVAVTWRPYSDGRWEWTDLGWYWVSDEPWAWATYHYGYWVNDPRFGWVWFPGTEWAPAWVSWRESPNYIGWCPFGPGGVALSPSLFVFVDIRRFRSPIRPSIVIVNNIRVINGTHMVSVNFRHESRRIGGRSRQVVVNVGPSVAEIGMATGESITAKPITEVVAATPVPEDVPRSGEIERPVLSEQKVEQWRERSDKETEKPEPTGREEPKVTPPVTEQPKSEQQPNQSVPEKPGQIQPTPPQQALPPTGPEGPQGPPQLQPGEQPKPAVPANPAPVTPTPETPAPATPTPAAPTPPPQAPAPQAPPPQAPPPQASPPQASPPQASPPQASPPAGGEKPPE